MKFTPNGLQLVSGARKDHRLLVWDIRYYRRPLNILSRVVDTNQRVYFDISPCGKYLISGGTDGILRVWNVDKVDWKSEIDVGDKDVDSSILKVNEILQSLTTSNSHYIEDANVNRYKLIIKLLPTGANQLKITE